MASSTSIAMADKLMQALQYSSYGGGPSALKHVELQIPVPKKGEILVKIEAASVNPVDWKIQSGVARPFLPPKFPYIPGTDIAGEVVAVGPGVHTLTKGDQVLSWLDLRAGGSFAEFAIAPLKSTVKKPPEVSAVDACCLPVAGLTALQAIRDVARVKLDGNSRANLLVTAASGGVGLYAVQIAKLGGAHVTATCGARNIELVKSLGADDVLDYKTPEGKALKSPSGRAYDAVIHCTSGIPWSTFSPNLKPVAKVIDLTPNVKSLATTAIKKLTLCRQELVPFLMSGKAEDLALLADLVKHGKLKTIIDSQYPLSRAEEAWARSIEGHATGKVVVTFGALATQVGAFAEQVVTKLDNASAAWANGTNAEILKVNNDINQNVFGWVNTSTTALNDTLNTFINDTTKIINDTFGGTVLQDPVQQIFNCLIGLKAQNIEKGLTWIHDNAHIDFPLFPNDTFSEGASKALAHTDNSTGTNSAGDSFLADPDSGASDKITAAVVALTDKLTEGIRTEALISTAVFLVWVLVVLIGLCRALFLFCRREKIRGEGGVSYAGDLPDVARSMPDRDGNELDTFASSQPRQGRPVSTHPATQVSTHAPPYEERRYTLSQRGQSAERGVDDMQEKVGFAGLREPASSRNGGARGVTSEYGVVEDEKPIKF